ncbi:MAG: acetamidase/formamidase family protein [Lachnospiraceae bacterium]|nr:acetamidase/formamidase family protein [Lachnospiraceae bacterium]
MNAKQTVFVSEYTNAVLDPSSPMAGPVRDGGRIVLNTPAGCWGPMLTPALMGGHEVPVPVYVEGAEPGDAVAIRVESVRVTSQATASGKDRPVPECANGDSGVKPVCPKCGTVNPKTHIVGIGKDAIRCDSCGAPCAPFEYLNGYTIAFDGQRRLGVTLNRSAAEKVAKNGRYYMQTPDSSIQNPAVTLAPHDLVGIAARVRPMVGQLGTMPRQAFPDARNAGDLGRVLLSVTHEFAKTEEDLEERTDGHMDINKVREGSIVICPVKVKGAGVYAGDVHAMQGDGEIAGHTTDVSAIVELQVSVIRGFTLEGPLVLPVPEDVPYLARPLSGPEKKLALEEAQKWGMSGIEDSAPISFVGSGADLNRAIDNAMKRAAALFDMTVPEVMNRITLTGGIDIGRAPGIVLVTMKVPTDRLRGKGIWELVKEQYRL